MKKYFLKQLKFEIWANRLLAEAIEKARDPDDRSLLLFSHILSAYSMWLSRLKNTEITTTLFQERSLPECIELMKTVFEQWADYLENINDAELDRVIHFIFPLDGSKKKMIVADAIIPDYSIDY